MKHTVLLTLLLFALLLPTIGSANDNKYFTIVWDSASGKGTVGELAVFNGLLTSKIANELRIVWTKAELDIPDDSWHIEVCQAAWKCWPFWVLSDTLIIPPNKGSDILQIKWTAGTPGKGTARVWYDVIGTNMRDSTTLEFEAFPSAVSSDNGNRSYMPETNGAISFTLPVGMGWEAWLYDIAGRRVSNLWRGAGTGNLQSFTALYPVGLPLGTYILRIEPESGAFLSRKVTIVR